MKKPLEKFKGGIVLGISFLLTIIIGGFIYASVGNIWTDPDELEATAGEPLTAIAWNKILANQNTLSGAQNALSEAQNVLSINQNTLSGIVSQLQISGGNTINGDVINIYGEANENLVGTEVFGDENETVKAACNARVKVAVGSQYVADDGGNGPNWIWVPARNFTTDGVGLPLTDNYYKRPIQYNGTNYICKGFAIMKYEASNSANIPVSNYLTTSRVNINQTNAISACRSLGRAYTKKGEFHLTTNNEYMAMARNIEQQNGNYSSGILCSGNVVGSDFAIIPANDDATELTKSCTAPASDNRRVLKLSNGAIIWDLAGNDREFVNKANTINGANYNEGTTQVGVGKCTGGFTAAPGCWVTGMASPEEMEKYGPKSITTGTAGGAGNLHGASGVASNVFLRGGTALYGVNAGVFSLYLSWNASNGDGTVGFRCVL